MSQLRYGNVQRMVEEGPVCIGAAVLTYLHVHMLGFPSCLSENTVVVQVCGARHCLYLEQNWSDILVCIYIGHTTPCTCIMCSCIEVRFVLEWCPHFRGWYMYRSWDLKMCPY